MPKYRPSLNGEMTFTELMLPISLEHTAQFLGYVPHRVWTQIQAEASNIKNCKIKKSSFSKIMKLSPRKITNCIVKEFIKEIQDDEYIKVGGVHDALLFILSTLSEDAITHNWIRLEQKSQPVTSRDKYCVQLLLSMYGRHPDEIGRFARLPEFDTPYSAIWYNGKICILTVIAPVKRSRVISNITEVNSEQLKKTLVAFRDEYTNIPLRVATHSFGYQLFMECVERPNIETLLAFNPHSFTSFSHHPICTKIFDNLCDTINEDLHNNCTEFVWEGTAPSCVSFLYNSHCPESLQQWVVESQVYVV